VLAGVARSHMPTLTESGKSALFLSRIFLGTASGKFLRPAASRLLLSQFRPYPIGFPPIKQPLALEAEATRFCVPQENGARKKRKFS
jgi:hypothetical protein